MKHEHGRAAPQRRSPGRGVPDVDDAVPAAGGQGCSIGRKVTRADAAEQAGRAGRRRQRSSPVRGSQIRMFPLCGRGDAAAESGASATGPHPAAALLRNVTWESEFAAGQSLTVPSRNLPDAANAPAEAEAPRSAQNRCARETRRFPRRRSGPSAARSCPRCRRPGGRRRARTPNRARTRDGRSTSAKASRVARSHSRMVLSQPPVTTSFPSGENATAYTKLTCPRS